ncbi:MAG: LamG-like jellyroll fold domain-containing protein [Kiritimatiellia bacterium]
MKSTKRFAGFLGITALAVSFCCMALAADPSRTDAKPAAVDVDQYADFLASEVLDIQDLAEGAEIQRRLFNRMTPPGLSWYQPMFPSVAPFDAANFDGSFLDNLLGEDRNSVAVYPLSLALDLTTRETLVYNAEGKLIATLPAEPVSREWAVDADPARVTLQLDLLPSEDVEPYLYVEDRIDEAAVSIFSKSAKMPRAGGFALKSLGAGQFGFVGIQRTNGSMQITVSNGMDGAEIYSYTVLHTASVVIATWTNDENEIVTETNVVWTPVSPPYDGIESGWECRTTNLLFSNGVAVWEDSDIPSNALVRFYAAAQPVDTDEDGLTDGAEILLHRTDPGLADTDGDGMPDGWEVEYGLNARSGLDPSMVCWWKFDDGEGTNALNSATDGYHGALMGFSGATNGGWTEAGVFGGALAFDGSDDWVRIAQETPVLTGGPFTVSAQVWLDSECASAWPEVVGDYEAETWNGYCLGFNENRAYAMLGTSAWIMDTNTLADQWVWVALEFDGTQMRLYLDGVPVGAAAAGFIPASNGFFAIGNGQDDSFGAEYWKGLIDDVRLYRAAIGTNGLAGIYAAQEDPDGDGWLNLQESMHDTDPFSADTDDDGISDGEDPEPTLPNQEPLVRFRHPLDGQQFSGPAEIVLASDWLYGSETPSHVVYEIVSELDGVTNDVLVAAGGDQATNWYAPPGDFHLLVYGVDGTGQTGETRRVDVAVVESDSFAALSAAEKQAVLENGPMSVEGVEEWTYAYAAARTGDLPVAVSGSRTVAGFANATNFTVIMVTNPYHSVEYKDRDLMYAGVTYNTPTTNLDATLYGVTRWGARLEADLPPPPVAPRSWPVAGDTLLVFDQNESGEWVGKVYPSLNNVASNDPFALLHIGYGWGRDAFLYRNGTYQTLMAPTNYCGEDDSWLVFGLNNEGQMVGAGFDYDANSGAPSWTEHYQPLVYRPGQAGSVLPVSTQALGGAAYAVNDMGVIVGCETSTGAVPRAVKWVDGNVESLYGLTDATESVALDISEDGAIAGMKKVDGQWQPFLAEDGGTNALSAPAFAGVDFREFWHVGKFGALGWGVSNSIQRLYWVIPDDDQDGLSDILEREIVDDNPADGLTSLADVSGSGDYDGDGLTNLQEWEAQTDPLLKDSDGDRIMDGADPHPLTNRDTDGDGMPNDWETYYGLNPGSASDRNLDPDGDGITNIEEFRLGSAPNSAAGLGYRFHREKMDQLRIDIQDSTNCAGTQSSRQFVQRRIQFVEATNPALPPMEFTFKIGVAGRVERQNSGYDQVRVNGALVFSGSNEGLGCQMADKAGIVLAKVRSPPGEIVLSYDTVDELFHVGAFAEVTDIELVDAKTNVLKVDSVDVHSSDSETHKIPAISGAAHADHFVCAKNTGDIVLNATVLPNDPAVFDQLVWEADGATITSPAVGTDKLTAKLSSATAQKIPVRIKIGGSTCWEGLVWVTWVGLSADYSTSTTELHPNNQREFSDLSGIISVTHLGLGVESDNPWSISRYFYAAIEWRGSISPQELIAGGDIPDLRDEISESGADHLWDVTREIKKRIWSDGVEITSSAPEWESDDGNIGSQIDEDNNPYDGPRDNPSGDPTGEIFSFDSPAFNVAQATLSQSAGGWGATQSAVVKRIFRESVRIKLADTWYQCSDYGYWRAYRSIIKTDTDQWGNEKWEVDSNNPNVIDTTHNDWN